MYHIPLILQKRLEQLGIDDEEQLILIIKYEEEAKEYISLMLPNFILSEKQLGILVETYIQYQLFSYVELESLVEDKKNFLDNLITQIIENDKVKQEQDFEKNRNKARIKVF